MGDVIKKEKYEHSIEVLKLASQMSEQYYKKPLLLSYSGGKDSDVLLQLALESGIKFEVQNSHTTVDAPQTVYHIREVFKKLNEQGINAYVLHARYKDGRLITMWNLIEKNKFPPTRLARYCCDYLKEQSTPNRFIALGVREAESVKRRGRTDFQTRSKKHPEYRVYRDLDTAKQVYEDAQKYDEVFDCKFISDAKKNKDLICNPIYYWTDDDVWNFIKDRKIKVNPLYELGFERVGCIGCPLAKRKEREKEFLLFPKYKLNYIRAFDRMDKSGYTKEPLINPSAQDVFDWWMEDPKAWGQTELEGWSND